MEKNWERTLPFVNIDTESVKELFSDIDNDIKEIKLIEEGCRTTNYIITSKEKKYLLKIFFSDEQDYKKEQILLKRMRAEGIPVQEVYKICKNKYLGNKLYGIYEYIEGISLSKYLKSGQKVPVEIVRQCAEILGKIHKHKFERIGFFNENLEISEHLPPVKEWYELFITERVINRLGEDTVDRIRAIVNKYEDQLDNLDKDLRLVHGDFQGTNILINNNNVTCILDWEFTMSGHPLADIGQLFRYDQYYDEYLIKEFEKCYRLNSDYVLQDNWYNLSKLRDMINLIQIINNKGNMPNKIKSIRSIMKKIIEILE